MNSLMSILMSASSLPNMNSASALASSVFPTPWAEEDERADRALGSLSPRGRGGRPSRRLDRLLLADDALVERVLHVEQPLGLLLRDARDGMPVHIATTWAISSSSTSAGRRRSVLPLAAERSSGSRARASARAAWRACSYSWLLIAASFSLVMRRAPSGASRAPGARTNGAAGRADAASSMRSIALSGRCRSVM
jgi:hypothetical protein